MSITFPKLEVYYIQFEKQAEGKKKDKKKQSNVLGAVVASSVTSASRFLTAGLVGGITPISLIPIFGMGVLSSEAARSLKSLIDENRFHIIRTPEELAKFENPNGNEWVINSKALKLKQYYIRHPKIQSNNLLIESKSFYEYIEEEQKDELINYIMSHCSAKVIQIDRVELKKTSVKAKAKVKEADINGGINYKESRCNLYSYSNPKGSLRTNPREYYYWIDNSIKQSIDALTEGASITQTYENDWTIGVTAAEAKTIGMDIEKHKKSSYSIHIEC